jgi:diguanylate cyclase (GGDEF)-like protein
MNTETLNPPEPARLVDGASIDKLSGLPDQNSTAEIYQDALDRGQPVLFIDIDDFRAINSVFSYRTGDHVISDLGKMIRIVFPENRAGRKGGDEFIVVFDDESVENQEKAYDFVDYVARYLSIKAPTGCRFSATVSAGFGRGFIDGDSALPVCEYLVRKAKLNGKNRLALLYEKDCVFRQGPWLAPAAKKYLGEYSLVQTKQILDTFRWYHANRIDRQFDRAADSLFKWMKEIAS